MTAIVQIGNSDNKLTQSEWSHFCHETDSILRRRTTQIHFHGFSEPDAPWQNACWVFEMPVSEDDGVELRFGLKLLARAYQQDSIALTVGATEFVAA